MHESMACSHPKLLRGRMRQTEQAYWEEAMTLAARLGAIRRKA